MAITQVIIDSVEHVYQMRKKRLEKRIANNSSTVAKAQSMFDEAQLAKDMIDGKVEPNGHFLETFL